MSEDKLKIITPILLTFLSLGQPLGLWILNDIKLDVQKNSEKIDNFVNRLSLHVEDPQLHHNLKKDIEWILKIQQNSSAFIKNDPRKNFIYREKYKNKEGKQDA